MSENSASAWVFGASSGLGRAVAKRLLEQANPVILSSRPGPGLDQVTKELGELGPVEPLPVDLSERDAIPAAVAKLRERNLLPEIVVFNGGGPAPATATALGSEGLDTAYELLLRPAYQVLEALGDHLREVQGTVVFLTSSGVFEPIPNLAASNVMRAGVTALMKSAAAELGPDGVRVLCVAPGRIATDRVAQLDAAVAERQGLDVAEVRARSQAGIPFRRYGTPAEFAAVVGFLCSPDASYMTGTTVLVDGGKIGGLLS